MGRVRTFIGVEISPGIRSSAMVLQRTLGKAGVQVKWVEPEHFHLTLHFLGDIDERDLHPLCKAIQKVARKLPEFRLKVEGVGAFPNVRRPKTLWAGLTEGATELVAMYNALIEPLTDVGVFRKEDRGYTPHLTLGRVNAEEDSQKLALELPKLTEWQGGDTNVGEIVLWSSDQFKEGFVYTVLGRWPLEG